MYKIYALYDKRNGNIGYIGATNQRLQDRLSSHKTDYHRNYSCSSKEFISQIGEENLEIRLIEECQSKEEMWQREEYWTNFYNERYNLVNIRIGQKHAKSSIEKNRKSHIGKRASKETKQKMSISRKGKNNSMWGKHHTVDAKEKNRKAQISKKVICIETGIVYNSLHDATRKTGIHHATICSVCKGKRKIAGGYHWEYVNQED